MKTTDDTHLKFRDLSFYSAFALPLGFVGIPLYLYAPDFFAVEYGLSLGLLGGILLLLRFVDALQDPYIGALSDRFTDRRSSVVVWSALVMAASFLLLFLPPIGFLKAFGLGNFPLLLWFALCTFLASTGFSVLTINLNTFGALWSKDENAKARIVTFREMVGLVGLIGALIIPALFQLTFERQASLVYFGAVVLVSVLIAQFMFSKWNRPTDGQTPKLDHTQSFLNRLKGDEGRLFRVYALSVLASAFPAVLVLMFVRDYLNLEASFPVFMMSYVFAGLAFMPLWKKLGQKLGLQTAWMISMLLGIVAFVGVVFLGEGDLLAFMLICIATGAVFGADVVLPQTLVALRVDADAQSRSQASGQFAFLSFLGKFALAVATGSALVMLHFGGFTPDGQNTQQSLFVLLCLYAFVPCVLKLLAFFSLLSAKPIFSKVSE